MNKFYKIFFLSFLFILIINSLSFSQCNASVSVDFSSVTVNGDGTCTFDIDVMLTRTSGNNSYSVSFNGVQETGVLNNSNNDDSYTFSVSNGSCNPGDYAVDVILYNDPNFNSECSNNSVTPSGSLPVEFLYFKAQPDTKFVKLEWATASEINNAFFSVEYSRDGNGYKEIGRVAGHGNSVETIEYEFMHETPLVGENFYRLRQEDFDGTFEYSEIAQIQLEGDQGVSIRPNLVKGELTVVVKKGYEKDTEAVIYDLVGAAVKTVTFSANTAVQTFEIEGLPNGHYFIHLQDGLTSHVSRFVKTDNY